MAGESGVTLFNGVGAAKLPMLQEITSCPCPCRQAHLNSVGHTHMKDLQGRVMLFGKKKGSVTEGGMRQRKRVEKTTSHYEHRQSYQ